MSQPLAQPPKNEERTFNQWMLLLWKRLTSAGGLPWSVVDKTGSNLTDIETRHHDDLQYIPADPVIYNDCDHEETPFIPPPQSYDFEHVTFPARFSIGNMAHVYSLQELMDHEWSAGVVDGATLTDNGNGTISLSASTAVLRATTDPHLTLYGVVTAAQLNIALTDDATNYVYLDWNSGSPLFSVSTSVTAFNCLDKCLAYVVHRSGNVLHWIDAREQNVDFNRKYRQFSLKIERFRHANDGTVLGSSGLAITLTAGTFYFMVQQIDHIAFDTTVAGTANANVFTLWYRNGVGGWTETANQKTVTTTTYDGNTGTPVTLGNNKFGVTWFYVINDSPSELHAVMGQAEYANLASAEAASPPASTPTIVSGMGSLVGFVVYEKGNTVFDNVLSTFSQSFTASAATTHNGLAGIQGGTTNEYYHLTASQSQQVTDFINRGAIGIPGMDGEDGEDGIPMPGPAGANGATGAQGPAGPQGIIGIGIDGEDGEPGMPIPGPQGETGPAGSWTGTVATAVNTTSGTSIDFTGIPSGIKRITIVFNGVSSSGTSIKLIRIGAGSVETTGYIGTGVQLVDAASVNSDLETTGFQIRSALASTVFSGSIILTNMGSNIWAAQGVLSDSASARGFIVSGAKTLSGALDRVRLTTVGGTDTFDAGSMNIIYES